MGSRCVSGKTSATCYVRTHLFCYSYDVLKLISVLCLQFKHCKYLIVYINLGSLLKWRKYNANSTWIKNDLLHLFIGDCCQWNPKEFSKVFMNYGRSNSKLLLCSLLWGSVYMCHIWLCWEYSQSFLRADSQFCLPFHAKNVPVLAQIYILKTDQEKYIFCVSMSFRT